MRCPDCAGRGQLSPPTGPACIRCLGSGRIHAQDRPLGELGRLLELSRRLRAQKMSRETRPADVVRIRPLLVAGDQDREPITTLE
ncbi:MAG: hypothetical protein SH850_09760 [Planctomycetaceae bacterium]|nr:hypothetical protein [Planctomycetaceae bacterium]